MKQYKLMKQSLEHSQQSSRAGEREKSSPKSKAVSLQSQKDEEVMSPSQQFQQLINIKLNNLQQKRRKTPNQSHQHSGKVSLPATQQQTQVFTQPQTCLTTKVGTNFVNSGGPTSQTIGTGFVTAIETFTYHGDNDLMNINEGNNMHTQYLHGNVQEPSKLWRLQNNQATMETLQRITFNS